MHSSNLDTIADEGERFLQYAERDPQRTVPQYPSWTLRELVAHVASIHGRTVAICETLSQERISAPQLPDHRDAFDWYSENLAKMLDILAKTDPDTPVCAYTPPHTVTAWERRMVIETGMHRWDAQQATEAPDPLAPIVATSGLDEFPHMWLPRLGDLPTIELIAVDLDRSWKLGDGRASATASGTASDLFLRLMARPGAELPETWEAAVDGLRSPSG